MNKKVLILLPALALLLGVGGCTPKVTPTSSSEQGSSSQPGGDVAVSAVAVDPAELEIEVGQTRQVTATVSPFNATNKDVTWSSDHPEFASVDGGMVTARAVGTAHIRATSAADSTKFDECTVTVVPEIVVDYAREADTTKAFKLGLYQANVKKQIYFDGGAQDGRIYSFTTTESYSSALEVRLVATTGGYHLSYAQGEATKYININKDEAVSGDSTAYHIYRSETAKTVWTWNAELATLETEYDDSHHKLYIGTNGNYETLSGIPEEKYSFSMPARFWVGYEARDPETVTVVSEKDTVYAGSTLQMEVELGPAGARGDISWSVSGNDKCTIGERTGILAAAADAELDSTVTVKASFSETVFGTKVITIKEALNYGTLEHPLTVEEVKTLVGKESPTAEDVYVSGVVTMNSAYSTTHKNWGDYIKLASSDGTQADVFTAYRAKADDKTDYDTVYAAANSLVGKRVIFKGVCEDRYGSAQVSTGGLLVSVADADRTPTSVSVSPAGTFEVQKGQSKTFEAKFLPVYATATIDWSVEAIDGAVAGKVTVSDGVASVASDATANQQYKVIATVHGTELSSYATIKVVDSSELEEVVLDKTSMGITVASGTYNSTATDFTVKGKAFSANNGVGLHQDQGSHANFYHEQNVLQFNASDNTSTTPTRLRGAITNSEALVVKQVTILWYSTYNSQNSQYWPTVKAGTAANSLAAVSANESSPLAGTDTGEKTYMSSQDREVYSYTTTYTLPAGSCFLSIEGGTNATYVKSITLGI